jgi:uncharacterized tellurite resistance protein B-like protein
MLSQLDRSERLALVKFVCSFVWADLEVADRERAFVLSLADALGLDAAERKLASTWLERPPTPEEVDPQSVPLAHRKLFLQAARAAVASDGRLTEEERSLLEVFEQLLG